MATQVLVVEDDWAIQELIRFSLVEAGFTIKHALSAEDALNELHAILPDVILIDWMLPGMSGLALLQRLRQDARTKSLPIIMVTAKSDEPDRINGLDRGADDYLSKPFSPRELVARINALLRRRAPEHAEELLVVGGLRLDPQAHEVTLADRPLKLGPTEFRLLRFMMAHPDRLFSRTQLLDKVWGDHVFIEERTIDVHIRRLRSALGSEGKKMIQTVRGAGYRLRPSKAFSPVQ